MVGVPTAMKTASAPLTAGREIGGEAQPARGDVFFDQRVETWLVDRHDAVVQTLDFAGVLVDAHDIRPEFGKTGAGHKAH